MDGRVAITVEGGVAEVRLTRGDKLNALDPAMFAAIGAAIAAIGARSDVRCIVLSGAGRAFCAGLDMAAMAGEGTPLDLDARPGLANAVQQVAWGWRELAVPVIAAVHGVAMGGGLQLMSGADIRIVAPDARLSIRELQWGLVPDMAGLALWRTLVRDDVLRELIYTAREFSGADALGYGFATRLADDPRAAALTLAREIATRSPSAIRAAKRLVSLAADADAAAILRAESAEQRALLGAPDQREAVRAGLERRPAVFPG